MRERELLVKYWCKYWCVVNKDTVHVWMHWTMGGGVL